MAESKARLGEILALWSNMRQNVIAELEKVPEDRFDFRVADGSRSILELAQHIADAGLLFMGECARAEGGFTRAPFGQLAMENCGHVPRAGGKDEVIRVLRDTWAEVEEKARGLEDERVVSSMPGLGGQPQSRFAMASFAFAHESYHAGQIAMCVRAMGQVPVLTTRLAALGIS